MKSGRYESLAWMVAEDRPVRSRELAEAFNMHTRSARHMMAVLAYYGAVEFRKDGREWFWVVVNPDADMPPEAGAPRARTKRKLPSHEHRGSYPDWPQKTWLEIFWERGRLSVDAKLDEGNIAFDAGHSARLSETEAA